MAEKYELWVVSTKEQGEPDKQEFATESELNAFLAGFDAADGWLSPYTFDSYEAALDHLRGEGWDDEDEE